MCGEHTRHGQELLEHAGSSPRVWGAYDLADAPVIGIRFIPTCVGSIVAGSNSTLFGKVHPHVCGEHAAESPPIAELEGSSPRVWGALRQGATSRHSDGSSPRVWGASRRLRSALKTNRFIPTCVGSISVVNFCAVPNRFIPTCVGSISFPLPSKTQCTVHPHVCGEHHGLDLETISFRGSSPRVWGAFGGGSVSGANSRFIPTCVGSILHVLVFPLRNAVHPHVCGEHGSTEPFGRPAGGSSPRVWGA